MNFYSPGALIAGRYEVAGRPLIGGMGIVYVCLDRKENRPVALKTFKPEYLPDRAARDRFLREGTAWVDLGVHPHVVRCYEVERIGDGTEVYLVLELIAKEPGCDDASLRAWLTPGRPLPVETALLFALQIARGMQHAVECIPGFVHRDLKPENVLVGADRLPGWSVNRLRVTDFGLATVLAGSTQPSAVSGQLRPTPDPEYALRHTQLTHGIVGTPLYMAPEQWRGEPVGVYTDVYALGCILYEMLSGQRTVAGNNLTALRRAHSTGEIRPLPQSLPTPIRELVTRCLALTPVARYADWLTVGASLAAAFVAVTGQAVPAPVPTAVLNRADLVATGWSYSAIGGAYLDLGKATVARGYFERAAEMGRTTGERRLEAAELNHLGLTYAALGEVQRAISYYEQALVIDREIGDRGWEGVALGNLGLAYAALGETRRAIGYYEQRLAIARRIGDRRGEGNALGNLGLAYAALGETQRAINYYEQALVIDRGIGDRRGEENALNCLGIAYKNLGETQQALRYYEQALAISRGIGDRRGEGNVLSNLGVVFKNMGDAHHALEYYGQALAIQHEIGDLNGVANVLFNMAQLYAEQGETVRALSLAQEAARIFVQIGSPNAQQARQLLARLQGGGAVSRGPTPAQILQQFAAGIAAVVAGARGDRQARAAVAAEFARLTQEGWLIAEPIQRIWAGERDEAALTAGLSERDALIVREILRQLAR